MAVKEDKGEEMVRVQLFKDGEKYKDDVFVAVNGRAFQIKRGEAVEVPKSVAEVLENSQKQDISTAIMMEEESTSYRKKTEALGL